VTRTTFEEIAASAESRAGDLLAFADKTELFFAMREQVAVPMIDQIDLALLHFGRVRPPGGGRAFSCAAFCGRSESDPAARRTFQIMGFKCEYVGELERELGLQRMRCSELVSKLTQAYGRARRARRLRVGLRPSMAALETCSFVIGLTRLWLLDAKGSLLRRSPAG